MRNTILIRRFVATVLGVTLTFVVGCPGSLDGVVPSGGVVPSAGAIDGNRGSASSTIVGGEPNGSFTQAIEAVFDASGVARLQGTVANSADLDVFSFDAIAAGDRIVIQMATTGSNLDVSIALFDGEGRLVSANDDAHGTLDSFIDVTARRGSNTYFLVATVSAFASPGTESGTYTADVRVETGGAVPVPEAQTLFLDFDGAMVNIPSIFSQPFTLDPFDAGDIDPVYAGQTETFKQLIVEAIAQNYQRFNVIIITSDDGQPDPSTEFSTLFLGGFDSETFGIAENVDLYNADFCDDAMIFTGSFSPRLFSGTPTVAELAVAIGNVAAHESGHLLGLNHTDDDLALMDDASLADAFIEDQEFIEAPLSRDIMSIGSQDSALLLSEIVGLRDGVTLKAAELVLRRRDATNVGRVRMSFDAFRGGEKIGLHAGSVRQLKAWGKRPAR
jgi:Matrixin